MKVCVLGMWHLGSVMSACFASLGHEVTGYDADPAVVHELGQGRLPVEEPGLSDLIQLQRAANRLWFSTDLRSAVHTAEILCVAYDTPVDDDDRADVNAVIESVEAAFPHLRSGSLVLVSSQLPVGSTRELERRWEKVARGRSVAFAYSPENLRLGNAIKVFLSPDRIVVGTRNPTGQPIRQVSELFGGLADKIVWMGTESAEMTKHAINAFLATSVAFINEVARVCELTGADAAEVERGLKTEQRIGPKAYVAAGAAFGGGTLARDVQFLRGLASGANLTTPFLDGLAESNRQHRGWPLNRIERTLGSLRGHSIGVWGLTYKVGTTALRRSDAVILCHDLQDKGAMVLAHDPSFKSRPSELQASIGFETDPIQAAAGADALVVATGWPQYREISADQLFAVMKTPNIIDANGFLRATLGTDARFVYFSVGRGPSSIP